TRTHARDAFGVAIRDDGMVDEAATRGLRAGRTPRAGFDFGAARERLDRVWTADAVTRYTNWLMPLPGAVRARARRLLHHELPDSKAALADDPGVLDMAWARVCASLGLDAT